PQRKTRRSGPHASDVGVAPEPQRKKGEAEVSGSDTRNTRARGGGRMDAGAWTRHIWTRGAPRGNALSQPHPPPAHKPLARLEPHDPFPRLKRVRRAGHRLGGQRATATRGCQRVTRVQLHDRAALVTPQLDNGPVRASQPHPCEPVAV